MLHFINLHLNRHFPCGSDSKDVCLQCGRPGFNPWVGKIPWRRKWQPTPALLPGKFHGWRCLGGYSPWGCKELDMTERLQVHFQIVTIASGCNIEQHKSFLGKCLFIPTSPTFHLIFSFRCSSAPHPPTLHCLCILLRIQGQIRLRYHSTIESRALN